MTRKAKQERPTRTRRLPRPAPAPEAGGDEQAPPAPSWCQEPTCGHPADVHAGNAGRCAAVGCTCQEVTP